MTSEYLSIRYSRISEAQNKGQDAKAVQAFLLNISMTRKYKLETSAAPRSSTNVSPGAAIPVAKYVLPTQGMAQMLPKVASSHILALFSQKVDQNQKKRPKVKLDRTTP